MSEIIYLLPENCLPFSPKGSTFSIKKVYLFCRKGRPSLKKPLNLFCKEGLQCNEKGVRHVIDVSILFYESSIILPYKLLSLQKLNFK